MSTSLLSSLYKLTLILYRKLIILISLLLLVILTTAQEKKDKKWDVNNPEGPYKEISFTVNEGTWMNLDVSPDGKDIVFDLLGDILTPD